MGWVGIGWVGFLGLSREMDVGVSGTTFKPPSSRGRELLCIAFQGTISRNLSVTHLIKVLFKSRDGNDSLHVPSWERVTVPRSVPAWMVMSQLVMLITGSWADPSCWIWVRAAGPVWTPTWWSFCPVSKHPSPGLICFPLTSGTSTVMLHPVRAPMKSSWSPKIPLTNGSAFL